MFRDAILLLWKPIGGQVCGPTDSLAADQLDLHTVRRHEPDSIVRLLSAKKAFELLSCRNCQQVGNDVGRRGRALSLDRK